MWVYNNVRIYVQEEDASADQTIARLQPIQGPTILHIFGYETPTYRISGKVVGQNNLNSLLSLRTTGQAYTLSGVDFYKNLYLSKINYKRSNYVYQTLDNTQSCYAPVYDVSMELME